MQQSFFLDCFRILKQQLQQIRMDFLIQEVKQLSQPRQLPTIQEAELRSEFSKLSLSKKAIDFLASSELQSFSDDLVYTRVFIQDQLDQELFVGGEVFDNKIVMYPFGDGFEETGRQVWFDQKTYKAKILDNKGLFVPSAEECIIRVYFHDPIEPKIFNIVNVFAKKELVDDQLVLHCIKFMEDKLPTLDLRSEYDRFLRQINSVVQDSFTAEWIALNILISSDWALYQQSGRILLNVYSLEQQQAGLLETLLKKTYSPTLSIKLDSAQLKDKETLTKRNLEDNSLHYGSLLVASNLQSSVLVDETVLQEGKISGKCLQNFSNISNFVSFSKIGIDYTYSIIEIPVRTSVLIFSHGRSFIEQTIKLKYLKQQEQIELEAGQTASFDYFIRTVHSLQESVEMDDQIQHFLNTQYLEMRRSEGLDIQPINLTIWIKIAQVLTVINGAHSMQDEFVKKAIDLDVRRIQRNQK